MLNENEFKKLRYQYNADYIDYETKLSQLTQIHINDGTIVARGSYKEVRLGVTQDNRPIVFLEAKERINVNVNVGFTTLRATNAQRAMFVGHLHSKKNVEHISNHFNSKAFILPALCHSKQRAFMKEGLCLTGFLNCYHKKGFEKPHGGKLNLRRKSDREWLLKQLKLIYYMLIMFSVIASLEGLHYDDIKTSNIVLIKDKDSDFYIPKIIDTKPIPINRDGKLDSDNITCTVKYLSDFIKVAYNDYCLIHNSIVKFTRLIDLARQSINNSTTKRFNNLDKRKKVYYFKRQLAIHLLDIYHNIKTAKKNNSSIYQEHSEHHQCCQAIYNEMIDFCNEINSNIKKDLNSISRIEIKNGFEHLEDQFLKKTIYNNIVNNPRFFSNTILTQTILDIGGQAQRNATHYLKKEIKKITEDATSLSQAGFDIFEQEEQRLANQESKDELPDDGEEYINYMKKKCNLTLVKLVKTIFSHDGNSPLPIRALFVKILQDQSKDTNYNRVTGKLDSSELCSNLKDKEIVFESYELMSLKVRHFWECLQSKLKKHTGANDEEKGREEQINHDDLALLLNMLYPIIFSFAKLKILWNDYPHNDQLKNTMITLLDNMKKILVGLAKKFFHNQFGDDTILNDVINKIDSADSINCLNQVNKAWRRSMKNKIDKLEAEVIKSLKDSKIIEIDSNSQLTFRDLYRISILKSYSVINNGRIQDINMLYQLVDDIDNHLNSRFKNKSAPMPEYLKCYQENIQNCKKNLNEKINKFTASQKKTIKNDQKIININRFFAQQLKHCKRLHSSQQSNNNGNIEFKLDTST